jgi:pyruvate formate lyase activating enzyme
MPTASSPLAELLARHTREGHLYEKLPEDRLRCVACGHRCLIPPDQVGICKVRFNEGGRLRVPWGYVGALQLDPVEKKPFFHALPGARALSFGMLGCDYHCGYCFTGDTVLLADTGPTTFADLFTSCRRREQRPDADLAFPDDRRVAAASGWYRAVRGVVRHRYQGPLVSLAPTGATPIRCTPDHRVYATCAVDAPPRPVAARDLRAGQYLAIPRRLEVARPRRTAVVGSDHELIPLRSVDVEPYEGDVYNMEVEQEHSYLAGLFAVSNCQNWITSQALRDPRAVSPPEEVTPAELVGLARRNEARIITSTYNEPLITSEWAVEVFRAAKPAGLVCSYVSNGNATPEVLDYLRPWIDLYKVDLKSFRDRHYRELGGTLERVLWTIRALHERGIWLEIVTLLIPGFNDSDEELTDIARFLVSVSPDVPWHVTAFHKDYKMTGPENTGVRTLLRAAEIGAREGLHFVYAGNLPGKVGRWENTWCPGCEALLIERHGFRVRQNRLRAGQCPECRRAIPGYWEEPAV